MTNPAMEAIKTRYLIPAWELSRNEIQLREQRVIEFMSQEYARHFVSKPVVRQLRARDLSWTSWETPILEGGAGTPWSLNASNIHAEYFMAITGLLQLTPWPWHTSELEIWMRGRRLYYVDLTMLQLSFKKVFTDVLAREMGLDILALIAGDNKYAQFLELFSNLRCEGFFSDPIIIEPFSMFELILHLSLQAPRPGTDVLMLRGYVADAPGVVVVGD